MTANKKKYKFFYCKLFVAIFTLFCVALNNALALEVKYPVSQSGIQLVDTNTPLPLYLKYIFDMGMFLGFASAFFSLAAAGVLYLMSPAKPELLASAKDRVAGAISGVLILVMTYLIITTLNPQLAIFKIGELQPIPAPNQDQEAGIYFYKSSDCSGNPKISTTNILDFGIAFNNQIRSAELISKPGQEYVSTMYSSPGLFGKCQDVDPTINVCQPLGDFVNSANSASIHTYDFNPKGDGVYLYRKPFFNTDGGWLKISNSQIESGTDGGVFGAELNSLYFKGDSSSECNVPIDEQICDKWDIKAVCVHKICPTLAGKEISSIQIKGNYIVFLLYSDPSDTTFWSYCQEFPTPNDINKDGPKQLKWEKTVNQPSKQNKTQNLGLPNWIYIYPVKNK